MQSTAKRLASSLVLSVALFASVVGGVAQAASGDPSQWGAEVYKKGSFDITELVPVGTGVEKVNEYEGQHR